MLKLTKQSREISVVLIEKIYVQIGFPIEHIVTKMESPLSAARNLFTKFANLRSMDA